MLSGKGNVPAQRAVVILAGGELPMDDLMELRALLEARQPVYVECELLNEPLKWQYFEAVLLVASGICIVNIKLLHFKEK